MQTENVFKGYHLVYSFIVLYTEMTLCYVANLLCQEYYVLSMKSVVAV